MRTRNTHAYTGTHGDRRRQRRQWECRNVKIKCKNSFDAMFFSVMCWLLLLLFVVVAAAALAWYDLNGICQSGQNTLGLHRKKNRTAKNIALSENKRGVESESGTDNMPVWTNGNGFFFYWCLFYWEQNMLEFIWGTNCCRRVFRINCNVCRMNKWMPVCIAIV